MTDPATAGVPAAMSDPVGVTVAVIRHADPSLPTAMLEQIVAGVAASRPKRRRLAQALTDRPGVLTDGRSPAPRVVGDLLLALRRHCAGRISPPICATCGKALRSLARRGDDWFCGCCARPNEQCSACHKSRPVCSRDEQGRPRCQPCSPTDDPVRLVHAVVAALDPAVTEETIREAMAAVGQRSGVRRQVAWAVRARPDLLTGAGAQTPVPGVLRLIAQLKRAGVRGLVTPACPRCERMVVLRELIDGRRLCNRCRHEIRAAPCGRCGAVRPRHTRRPDGTVWCQTCASNDPANLEPCTGCGRTRPVRARTPEGPFCDTCRPWPLLTCAMCDRVRPCRISAASGQPVCRTCVDRWVPCSRCRQLGPRRGGTRDQPLCATCTRPETTLWRTCPACGAAGRRRTGKCARCTLYARVDLLLTGADGRIRPELQPLRETLRAVQRPRTLQAWLDNDRRAAILQGLAAGLSVSHAALDELPAGKTVDYLRDVLVTVGVLERRDEHMHRLERWTEQLVAARTGEPQQVLRRYANWHVTRRLRARTGGRETTYHQHYTARRTIQAAAGFLDWLTEHQRSLGTLRQDHVDAWLATDPTKDQSRCREAAPFLNWARRQRLTTVRIDSRRWAGPSQPLDNDARWQQARRLLHDQEIDTADRVAGLLVLLYAQRTAAIARLTLEHVTVGEDTVVLHLGAEPIALPDPLGTLAAELVQHRRTHPVTGTRGTRGWLFPGEHPGRPISSKRLNDRLHRLGLRPAKARSTALFQLAADLPAALLARLLGLHISSATGWQRASSGDWTAYAADLINRPPPHFQTP